ncbi:hypothetical protein D3C76_436900 [compost metagenome]
MAWLGGKRLLPQSLPALQPLRRKTACSLQGGFGFALAFRQLLQKRIRPLPVVPLALAFIQPERAILGQRVAELGQIGLQPGPLLVVSNLQGIDALQQVRAAVLGAAQFDLQALQLVGRQTGGAFPVLTDLGGLLQGRLATVQLGQGCLQPRQRLFLILASGGQCCMVHQLQSKPAAFLLPQGVLFLARRLRRVHLPLVLHDALGQRGKLLCQHLSALPQSFQFLPFCRQGLAGFRYVQRLIGADRRMLVGAAQRTGLVRLELGAIAFQGLDALLLFEQLFLVAHLLLQVLVLTAQRRDVLLLPRMLATLLVQFRLQAGQLCLCLRAGLGNALQMIEGTQLLLPVLPLLAHG